jgi:hypothetical protein
METRVLTEQVSEGIMIKISICVVFGSLAGIPAILIKDFRGFSQSFEANVGILTVFGHDPFLPNHLNSSAILPFNSIEFTRT